MKQSLIFRLHPGKDLIETYLRGHLGQANRIVIETHLLLCDSCGRLCAETDEQVKPKHRPATARDGAKNVWMLEHLKQRDGAMLAELMAATDCRRTASAGF
jgi:anti-sigma factor ChrR (cupin superfamily)